MKTVYICSPYRGDVERNVTYARAATRDSVLRSEAPFTPHLLYTQFLNDEIPNERRLGMKVGQHFLHMCDFIAVYTDLGTSEGMKQEIAIAEHMGILVVYRTLGGFVLR